MQPIDNTFSVPPFPAFPSVSRYVAVGTLADSLDRVSRSIESRESLSLVVGPPGTGKSLLCGLLEQKFATTHDVVLLGETPIGDAETLQRHLLHQLGESLEQLAPADLHLALIDRICDAGAGECGLLLIVDEAQSLSPEVIEAIRMITNIIRDGEPRVSVVMCGGVKLEETLAIPAMEAFAQRISTRCYLHALNAEETGTYIRETIEQFGADADSTINAEAIAAVHHACMGVPRLINQLVTEAIDCAEDLQQEQINEKVVEQAWAQLQQLPSPIVEEPAFGGESSSIEFGQLDDSPIAPRNDIQFELASDEYTLEEEIQPLPAQSALGTPSVIEQPNLVDDYREIVDEPVPAISTQSIFGDFEEEESLNIGNGVAGVRTQASEQQSEPEAAQHGACQSEATTELETVLHQEIIGISTVAADSIHVTESVAEESFAVPETGAQETGAQETGAHAAAEPQDSEPACEASDAETPSDTEVVAHPAMYQQPASEQTPSQPAPPSALASRDDSDLLVIEDEVEISSEAPKKVDAQEKTISVDFQAMLTRMRSGT